MSTAVFSVIKLQFCPTVPGFPKFKRFVVFVVVYTELFTWPEGQNYSDVHMTSMSCRINGE
jgi:hypothetical protein